ncbi:MAG TPA: hypothetical protein VE111_13450 [Bradyrhizobium sp.]|nr:hypothetical protein [Bradyrhizobium sp.]
MSDSLSVYRRNYRLYRLFVHEYRRMAALKTPPTLGAEANA